jgi:preprotein translocase subunit SecF
MTDTQNKSSNAADVEDAIPMKRMKPTWLFVAGGGVLVVIGLIVFAMHGSADSQAEVKKLQQKAGAQLTPEQAREKREEMKEHLKLTRGALEKVAEQDKAEQSAAAAKKQQEEQQKQEEAQKEATQKAATVHRVAGKKMKKSLDSLDNYASQLK